MQDDGLIVLYSESGDTLWANGNLSPNLRRGTPLSEAQGVDKDSLSYRANTGDDDFDWSLDNLDRLSRRYPDDFTDRLSGAFGVSKVWVDGLIKRDNIPPADVYMIAKAASVTNRPLAAVERTYKANRGQGWGVIAQRLGIEPGSDAFQALKTDDSGFLSKGKGQDRKNDDN